MERFLLALSLLGFLGGCKAIQCYNCIHSYGIETSGPCGVGINPDTTVKSTCPAGYNYCRKGMSYIGFPPELRTVVRDCVISCSDRHTWGWQDVTCCNDVDLCNGKDGLVVRSFAILLAAMTGLCFSF